MLGKGLDSLIPSQNNPQDSQSQNKQPGADFYSDNSGNVSDKRIVNQEVNMSISNNTSLKSGKSGESTQLKSSEENQNKDSVSGESAKNAIEKDSPEFSQKYHHRLYHDAVFHIEIDKIKPNPHQPRKYFSEESLKELAASIREFGIIQPLVVSKIEKETDVGTSVEYQLIAGERRLMASKMLGMERVPAIVRRVTPGLEQMELAIVENIQRADLNPIETGRAYAKLQDEFGMTQREIASRLAKSREVIANTLRLLNLPSEIQDAVANNEINESQARLLLVIDDVGQQMNVFHELKANKLSVRELRSRLKKSGKNSESAGKPAVIDPEMHQLQEQLTDILGTPVKIETTEKGGKIVIPFYSSEEIAGIVKKLTNS